MNVEEKMKIVGEYRNDLKMLKEIVEMAEEIHYRNSCNIDVQSCMENVIESANEAIVKLAQEFAEIESLNEENQQGKLGYAFTWLKKLKNATDEEREQILRNWLAEISEKKSAEVATE